MIKIGITGGIGSGKSIIATLLEISGIPVYIADNESKELTNNSPVIQEKLIRLFGDDIYTATGLNKKLLASHIFENPVILKQVNAIIHPEVERHFLDWADKQQADLCAIESAILFESGFNQLVDISLMVYAPLELRIERTLARDSASREDVIRRISNQLPDEIKKERSDYVIYNDDRKALLPQLNACISDIRKSNRIH